MGPIMQRNQMKKGGGGGGGGSFSVLSGIFTWITCSIKLYLILKHTLDSIDYVSNFFSFLLV